MAPAASQRAAFLRAAFCFKRSLARTSCATSPPAGIAADARRLRDQPGTGRPIPATGGRLRRVNPGGVGSRQSRSSARFGQAVSSPLSLIRRKEGPHIAPTLLPRRKPL
jgi:hypothetical protein